MRLVDIDSLKGCAIIRPTSSEEIAHIQACNGLISHKDIPTAYDVEAMVAEPEKLKDEYVHHCIHGTFQRGFIDGAKIATMKAIQIVRNGGKE